MDAYEVHFLFLLRVKAQLPAIELLGKSRYDICIVITFSILSTTEIQNGLITAFGDHAPSIQTTSKWMRTLSEGCFDMSDDSLSGKPLTACGDAGIAAVQQSIAEDKRKLCEEIAKDVLISKSSVNRALADKVDFKK
ncbi:histone-lysine N-methyltransferase SETMAR [Plakobranchus ocellatus]|uniref:Histone-lysine N-methyltransferase SETMAR n=1 Tax=Plakobranchus ocellatus TaxID=259542 RepID=A0AAV3ZJB1_9GAST|nr:histone-lysine N-methyltransferase SETMAR [Plakobranchus ocellatus]